MKITLFLLFLFGFSIFFFFLIIIIIRIMYRLLAHLDRHNDLTLLQNITCRVKFQPVYQSDQTPYNNLVGIIIYRKRYASFSLIFSLYIHSRFVYPQYTLCTETRSYIGIYKVLVCLLIHILLS